MSTIFPVFNEILKQHDLNDPVKDSDLDSKKYLIICFASQLFCDLWILLSLSISMGKD